MWTCLELGCTSVVPRPLFSPLVVAQVLATMTQLNSVGEQLGSQAAVHAMTDVTGFGLCGHLLEVCRGSGLGAVVTFDKVREAVISGAGCIAAGKVGVHKDGEWVRCTVACEGGHNRVCWEGSTTPVLAASVCRTVSLLASNCQVRDASPGDQASMVPTACMERLDYLKGQYSTSDIVHKRSWRWWPSCSS
jgi:hypothetical protein